MDVILHINKFDTISKCEESHTSDRRSLLIAIKFQAAAKIRIEKHLLIRIRVRRGPVVLCSYMSYSVTLC